MMSSGRSPQLLFIILVLLSLVSIQNVVGFNSGVEDGNIIKCIESERHALLMIKQGLIDEYVHLSSWGDDEDKKECCKWRGVSCSNQTGHVLKLNLQFTNIEEDMWKPLRGNLSSSLLELQQLNYLDLSFNHFGRQPIPEFFGSLNKLQHLNLLHSGFGGPIPYQLGNLSRLQSLDLSGNYGMYAGKLEWLSHLSVLRHISLNSVNLIEAVDWLQVISELPSLTELQLCGCNLQSPVTSSSSISFVNSSKSLAFLVISYNDLSNSIYLYLSNVSSSIVHLELNSNHLEGPIPQYVFSNMTFLRHLDLSRNNLQGPIPQYVFSNMTFLRYLDLSYNNLQGPIPQYAFSNMTFLRLLDLSFNNLQGPIPKYAISNMTSLQHIYLFNNQIDGIDAEAFTNMCSLKYLDLHSNNLTVQLSDLLFNLSDCTKGALEILILDYNMLCGSLPDFTEFISLKELHISYNRLNAITPTSIGQPLKLELLDISSNSLEGTITEVHMSNLPELKFLYLDSNLLLTLNFSSGWVPSFQLQTIRLMACKQGPHFPKWLQTQKHFSELDISNNLISDAIPTWFWDLSPNLYFLNLSYNHMKGMLPDLSLKFVGGYPGIDLSSNEFAGPIPLVPSKVTSLNLSKNKFSGSISFLCSVRGETFAYLDLSDNLLSGELPNCSWPFETLTVLNLANNNFSGKFPDLMGSTCSIESLNLRNNNFIGELPRSLNMCNQLKIFDVGDNNFSGTIPTWIGDSLPKLIGLAFRSNRFNGSIPLQLCQLSNVQLVDFSLNNISGTIPKCLNNLTAMVQNLSSDSTISISYDYYWSSTMSGFAGPYNGTAILVWKGMDREYKENLRYLKSIDLSSNKLSGEIPVEITTLDGLRSLNLSRNSLIGPITPEIGSLNLLESLDLSNNQLIGEIPPSFSSLNFLGILNLSNNNLSGKIPLGTQLQSFDANSYMGNPQLCGSPLNKCQDVIIIHEPPAIITHNGSNEDAIVTLEFYVCVAIGFIVGFWGVVGSLILNRSWRHAYFQFLNQTKDRLYVAMVLNIAKLQRRPMNYDR